MSGLALAALALAALALAALALAALALAALALAEISAPPQSLTRNLHDATADSLSYFPSHLLRNRQVDLAMCARVTASQIAKELGLAQSTVSHVLNGRGDELGIRSETQLRVRETARDLGYMPNVSARAMRSGRFGAAALMQSAHRLYLPHGLLFGLTEGLSKRNMRLTVAETVDTEWERTANLPQVMRELSVDGLFINTLLNAPPQLQEAVHASRVPAVWINLDQPEDCVYSDDFRGAQTATKHLLKLGHRDIAFIKAGPYEEAPTHYSVGARRGGYEKAMKAARLQPQVLELPPGPVWNKGLMEDRREKEALALLKSPDRPSALIAYEMDTALPVLLAARTLGLRIPGDLSLLMFHDSFEPSISVSITTMMLSMKNVGLAAVEMLEQKIEQPGLVLPPRPVEEILFDGETCGPPL
jgi:LacI family transcriptional regulator